MKNTGVALSPVLLSILQNIDPAELEKLLLEKFAVSKINGEPENPKGEMALFSIKTIENETKFPGKDNPVYLPADNSTEAQLQRQLWKLNGENPLLNILGQWPGDESTDELLAMLTK